MASPDYLCAYRPRGTTHAPPFHCTPCTPFSSETRSEDHPDTRSNLANYVSTRLALAPQSRRPHTGAEERATAAPSPFPGGGASPACTSPASPSSVTNGGASNSTFGFQMKAPAAPLLGGGNAQQAR